MNNNTTVNQSANYYNIVAILSGIFKIINYNILFVKHHFKWCSIAPYNVNYVNSIELRCIEDKNYI